MLTTPVPVRKTALLLFLGLSACYMALAPGSIEDRGYLPDDMKAGMSLLSSFNAWVKGRPSSPISWTRHGPVPILFDLPFIKFGKLFGSPDFMMSLEPLFVTAALLTVVYIWLRRVCTPGMSLLLTLTGAFGTMLWPYAYIGMETKQSLFVSLAGYSGLAGGKIRTWPKLLTFSTLCALAISMKSTGIVLAPPIAYLAYLQFHGEWRAKWRQALTALGIIACVWGLNALGWRVFWKPAGGPAEALKVWLAHTPLQFFANAIGIFGSPQKGLLVFAPILLICFYAVPRVFRSHRQIVIFGLLVTASTAAFLSVLLVTADEVWGSRFMHVSIAPLMIVIGAACPRFHWRHVSLLVLAVIGLSISFLGAFYYYPSRPWAAFMAGQNTMEWLVGDTVWNEVEFDARLFRVWLKDGNEPVLWTPSHIWVWMKPPETQPWKTINLRDLADPQSFLLSHWKKPLDGPGLVIFRVCWISLFIGPLVLLWVIWATIKSGLAPKPY